MSQAVDLNALRTQILSNQAQGQNLPARREDKVFVDRNGNITQGQNVAPGQQRQLSEIHQGIFATHNPSGENPMGLHRSTIPQSVFASPSRYMREGEVVARKLPPGTTAYQIDGVQGWLYSLYSALGDYYQMFVYFDGSLYQTLLIYPRLEGQYGPHAIHLYSDGRICLSLQIGMYDLESAYAKSVLWAAGCSVFLRTGTFPFSVGNA